MVTSPEHGELMANLLDHQPYLDNMIRNLPPTPKIFFKYIMAERWVALTKSEKNQLSRQFTIKVEADGFPGLTFGGIDRSTRMNLFIKA